MDAVWSPPRGKLFLWGENCASEEKTALRLELPVAGSVRRMKVLGKLVEPVEALRVFRRRRACHGPGRQFWERVCQWVRSLRHRHDLQVESSTLRQLTREAPSQAFTHRGVQPRREIQRFAALALGYQHPVTVESGWRTCFTLRLDPWRLQVRLHAVDDPTVTLPLVDGGRAAFEYGVPIERPLVRLLRDVGRFSDLANALNGPLPMTHDDVQDFLETQVPLLRAAGFGVSLPTNLFQTRVAWHVMASGVSGRGLSRRVSCRWEARLASASLSLEQFRAAIGSGQRLIQWDGSWYHFSNDEPGPTTVVRTLGDLFRLERAEVHLADWSEGDRLQRIAALGLGALLWGPRRRARALQILDDRSLIICSSPHLWEGAKARVVPFAEVDASLARERWGAILVDPATLLRNPDCPESLIIRGMKGSCRLALSARPLENRMTELWSVMEFLNPGLLGPRGGLARNRDKLLRRVRIFTLQ